ncbi:helix-turn-helix domain-containing protein [Halobacteria archaeon HArc-gm2]|nr:helix-turn-helix domain-containing protein [Halobacteria archaeon HArc-gm2]
MVVTTRGWLFVALLVACTGIMSALAGYASRHRREPGAVPFALLMVSLSIWSGGYAIALLTPQPAWRLFWEDVQWIGTTLHLWLFLFALAYTGHDQYVTRRSVALLGVFPTLSVLAFWTNPWHRLMWTEVRVLDVDGLALVEFTYGPGFWVHTLYTYVLIAVAVALLVRLVFVSDYLYTDQSVLLLLGIATPFVANVLDIVFLEPGQTIDLTPYAFTVTGLAFGYALFRRQLFDLVPATRQLGRNAAISQLDAGVVIVDNAHRIVYSNAVAGEILGYDPGAALGKPARSFVDESRIDFGAEDALAEIELEDSVYEVRISPIVDRHDRQIGNTLVYYDVTARFERERELAAHRDELATLNDLNAVIRGVNQALVSAPSRERIERTVSDRVVESDLYRTACIADVATWTGDADRWTVAGDHTGPAPPALDDALDGDVLGRVSRAEDEGAVPTAETDDGTWVVVPVGYGRTVYGVLGLDTERADVSDRERAVLGELGESIGHAINAVETRRLLSAESIIELELEHPAESDPLAATAAATGADLTVSGFVPATAEDHLAYVHVTGAPGAMVSAALDSRVPGSVRTIRDGETDGLVEWSVAGESLLGTLLEFGSAVQAARTDDDRATYEVEVPADANVRALTDHLDRQYPDAVVVAKRERTGPLEEPAGIRDAGLAGLTDRQREVIEAAYRAGYFNWPRDSTAEDVADSLDITAPTLHAHLRKAEGSLLTDLFDRADVE